MNFPFYLMEEKSREFNSISAKFLADALGFLEKSLSCLSTLSSDPLFSSFVALYTLILLYLPLGIVFSPILISTGILLLTLLRLGASQRVEKEFNSIKPKQSPHDSKAEDHKWVSLESNSEPETEMDLCLDWDSEPFYANLFVEWNVRAPLEVIHEEYEGEEDEQNHDIPEKTNVQSIERYPSLSLYYPESESDSSSDFDFPVIGDWDSPERLCSAWDEEDREGLIELALDGKRTSDLLHDEEDNLIEIDISPARTPARSGTSPAINGEFSERGMFDERYLG